MSIDLNGNLKDRTEELYISDEYKLFFLTGQANGTHRRAYVAIKPFHALDEETIGAMRAAAKPGAENKSDVRITSSQGHLAFLDNMTGTVTNIPWTELDVEVQKKLGGVVDPFSRYAAKKPASADAPAPPLRKLRGFSL